MSRCMQQLSHRDKAISPHIDCPISHVALATRSMPAFLISTILGFTPTPNNRRQHRCTQRVQKSCQHRYQNKTTFYFRICHNIMPVQNCTEGANIVPTLVLTSSMLCVMHHDGKVESTPESAWEGVLEPS